MLKPHLHRCRSLHVDAHLSSSLPFIYKTFSGIEAPYLTSMELVCDAYADDEYDEDSDAELDDEFNPRLTHLVIDGKNFCRPAEESNCWIDRRMGLNQLTIAQYKGDEYEEYSLKDFLDSVYLMVYPSQIKFEGLHFPRYFHDDLDYGFMIPFVQFEGASKEFISGISEFATFSHVSVLRITRCPLPNLHNFLDTTETLILEDIDSTVDLLDAVAAWQGENLWLDRCHSFSDVFLEALASPILGFYPCGAMRRLLLHRLPNFSIILLKEMVEGRNALVHYNDPNWKTATGFGPSISHLAVVRCGIQKLSAQDEEWFRSHLVEFYWVP